MIFAAPMAPKEYSVWWRSPMLPWSSPSRMAGSTWFSSISTRSAGRFWEFPQGTWEQATNYTIEDLARGELREETGLVATELEFLARIYIAYGFLTQPMHVFVATGLTQLDAQPERKSRTSFAEALRGVSFTRW